MRLNALHPEDNPMEALLFCFGGDDDDGGSGGDDMDRELDAISDQFDAMDEAYERGDSFQTHGHSGYTSRDDDGNVTDHSGGLDSSREFASNATHSAEDIRQIYIDELGREPDPEGAEYWSQDSGLTLDQVRTAINNSPEGTEFDSKSSDPGNRDAIAIKADVPRDTIVGSGPAGTRAVTSSDGTPVTSSRAVAEAARNEGVSESEIRDRINSATIDLAEEAAEKESIAIDDAFDPTIPVTPTVTPTTSVTIPVTPTVTPTTSVKPTVTPTDRTTYAVDPSINELVPAEPDIQVLGQDMEGNLVTYDASQMDLGAPVTQQDYENMARAREVMGGAEVEDLGMPEQLEEDRSSDFTFEDALAYALTREDDVDAAFARAEAMTGASPYSFEREDEPVDTVTPRDPASLQGGLGLGFDIEQLPGADQIQFNALGEIISAPKEFQDAYEEMTNRNPLTGEYVLTVGGSLERGDALSQEIESLLQEGYRLGQEDDELISPEGITVNVADLMNVLEGLAGGPEGGSEGGGGQEGERGGGGARGGASLDPGGAEEAADIGQDLIDIDLPEVEADLDPASIIPDAGVTSDTESETDGVSREGDSEETTGEGAPGGAIGGEKTGGVSILPGEEGPILPGGEGSGVVGAGGDDIFGGGDEGTGGGVGGGAGTGSGAGTGTGSGDGTGTGVGDGSGTGTGPGGTGGTDGTGPGSGTDGDGTGGDDDDSDDDFEIVEEEVIDPYEFGIDDFDPLLDFEYRQPQITSPFDFARDFGSYTLSPEIEQSFQELTERRRAAGFEPAALYEPEFLEQIGIMTPERQAEPGIAALIGSRFPRFTPAEQRYPFSATPEESAEALVNELLGRT